MKPKINIKCGLVIACEDPGFEINGDLDKVNIDTAINTVVCIDKLKSDNIINMLTNKSWKGRLIRWIVYRMF